MQWQHRGPHTDFKCILVAPHTSSHHPENSGALLGLPARQPHLLLKLKATVPVSLSWFSRILTSSWCGCLTSGKQKLFSSPVRWETWGCSKAVPKTWLGNKWGGTSLVPMNEKLPGSCWVSARDLVLQTKITRKSGPEDNPKGNPILQHGSARKGTALLAGLFQKPVNATRNTRGMEEWLHFLLSLHQIARVSKGLKCCRSLSFYYKRGDIVGDSSCLWISFNGRSKIVGVCFCQSCLLKFGKNQHPEG